MPVEFRHCVDFASLGVPKAVRSLIPECTVRDIVGHERSTLAGSIFNGISKNIRAAMSADERRVGLY